MPYTPYQSTWQNAYLAQSPYMPQLPTQTMQPYQQPVNSMVKVDGPTEAMNRFLMRYPASQLVAGFVSDALFDVNGRQFYTLSIEADGRRNLETFDYAPHVEQQPIQIDGAQFVSRQEFESFTAKVNAALGALNGVHAAVPTTGTADATESADGAAPLHDARRPVSANL